MVMHRTEPSRLQSLSLQLSDKLAQLVENNERLLELRPGGNYFFKKSWKLRRNFPAKTILKAEKMSTLLETFVWIFLIDLNGHLSRNAFSRKTQCSLVCFCHKKFFPWKCQTKFPSSILSKIYTKTKNDENFSIQYDRTDPTELEIQLNPLWSVWIYDFEFDLNVWFFVIFVKIF